MASTDTLFNTLGIPRQIVVNNKRAELKINTFRTGFSGDHDSAQFAEVINQSRTHISCA